MVLEEEGYNVRKDWLGDVPIVLTKMSADGLTSEHVEGFIADPPKVLDAIDPNMTTRQLPDQDGRKTYQFSVATPMMVSDRTMFITYYPIKDEATGTVTMCAGSIGNQHFEESETEAIGSHVVGVIPCSYVRFTPREGGYDVEQASCFDAQGWLPGFIQGLGVTAQ